MNEIFKRDKNTEGHNNLQLVVGDLSGYHPNGDVGAHDDGYYESSNKFEYVKSYVEHICDFDLRDSEISLIVDFLEGDFEQDERFYEFQCLKPSN